MPKARSPREPVVAIVSANAETLDGLQSYLRDGGISARSLRSLDDVVASPKLDAYVLFPDDFRWESVLAALAELSHRNGPTLPVLVTAHPKRFSELALGRSGDGVLVIPRPVWGWTILDVIRSYVARSASSNGRGQLLRAISRSGQK